MPALNVLWIFEQENGLRKPIEASEYEIWARKRVDASSRIRPVLKGNRVYDVFATYRPPSDPAAFDYEQVHVPLDEKCRC